MSLQVSPARRRDLPDILATMTANRRSDSLFQQSEGQLSQSLEQFLVARRYDRLVGCVQVLEHAPGSVEILAVAVHPDHHGRGVGGALMCAAITRARSLGDRWIWLGTAKPRYFYRFGFREISKWRMPLPVLLHKLRKVFQQPLPRWVPSVTGHHVFMTLS